LIHIDLVASRFDAIPGLRTGAQLWELPVGTGPESAAGVKRLSIEIAHIGIVESGI